jgi:hypothetical protein
MDGRLTIGIQGFGLSNVSGRRRVPSPPHIMHTFIVNVWCWIVLSIVLAMKQQRVSLLLTEKFIFILLLHIPDHTRLGIFMTDDGYRILPVTKGTVQCLPDKKEPTENCSFCIHCREFQIKGKFVKSPSLAYCTRCRVTDRVDLSKAQAVKCADRQGEGFHSITSIIS